MFLTSRKDYLILLLGDLAVFVLSLWLTLCLRYLAPPSWRAFELHLVPFSLLFGAWLLIFFLAGLYDRHTSVLRNGLFERLFYTQALNMLLAALFFFFVPSFGIAPKTILFIYLIISSVLVMAWRVSLYPRTLRGRRADAILIGSGSDIEDLRREVDDDPWYPFRFATFIDTGKEDAAGFAETAVRQAGNGATIVVVDNSDRKATAGLPAVYEMAFERPGFLFFDAAFLYEAVFERVPLTIMQPPNILTLAGRPVIYSIVKRAMDVVIGLVGSALCLIALPFLALAIKLEDGGPIFVVQERVGRFQRPIRIRKFRSMSGSDTGAQALQSQHVVTRVGRFIRRTHIDEFPQFLNLVRGDLSFVGPRPELPALAAHYAAHIPHYRMRHLIKPGLTGWARVRHQRDPHHGTDVAETRIKLGYDLYYVTHRSLMFDLYITFQTVRFILTARGS
jgi:lipopolysaccharide/colanic/teichoic acid biosynthesis glycosyltransferase